MTSSSPPPPMSFFEVPYLEYEGKTLHLAVYRPTSFNDSTTSEDYPCVIHVHGGGWVGGSHVNVPPSYEALIESGVTLISVEFTMPPDVMNPVQLWQVKAAIRFVRANAKKLRVNPARIVIAGESSGGYTALLAAYSGELPTREADYYDGTLGKHQNQSSRVRAVSAYFPPTRLASMMVFPPNVTPRIDWFAQDSGMTRYFGPITPETPESWSSRYSPLNLVERLRSKMPTFLVHGLRDDLVSVQQTQLLQTALVQNNQPVECYTPDSSVHGWWISQECDVHRMAFLRHNLLAL